MKMDKKQLLIYLSEADNVLRELGKTLSVHVVGGANICIYCDGRRSTHDIDTYTNDEITFNQMREIMALKFSLPINWINSSAALFVTPMMLEHSKLVMNFNNLKAHFLNNQSMLVLKAVAGREDSFDLEDAIILIKKIPIKSVQEIMELVDYYMPGWNNEYVKNFAAKAFKLTNSGTDKEI